MRQKTLCKSWVVVINMISIARYNESLKSQWDEVVRQSRNGTFLHLRDYMDYHHDRFVDHSLVARKGNDIIALLPACIDSDTLYSHRGLTFGGWIVPMRHFDVTTMLDVWQQSTMYMKEQRITRLVYKAVPHIYHRYPTEEDLYAIFRANGTLIESNISSVIDLDEPLLFDRGNKRNVNLATRNNVSVGESQDWEKYWSILQRLLMNKYGRKPVHSLDEIKLLQSRFPENIKLYTATLHDELLAGVVMYYSGDQVAHCQYISSTPRGRELKSLALLFDYLIKLAANIGFKYFDFGISNEDGGRYLNEGLVVQKCRMGGRGIVYNTYSINL